MDLLSSLKNLLGYWALQATSSSGFVSNWIFDLHYKFTSAILIICSIIVIINQYCLSPIKCMSNNSPSSALDTFCWMTKNFQFAFEWSKADGLKPPTKDGEQPTYHSYYQWTYVILFLQAIMFYVPCYFWKRKEKGRIKKLILGLDSPTIPEDAKKANIKLIVEYLLSSLGHNSRYFFYFVTAEILNFVNVVVQVYLIDKAFGGIFSTYGLQTVEFSELESYERNDTMVKIFPRIIKCTLHRFGASGFIQRFDSMCVLPINEVNEKIYIFLFFWFCALAIMSAHALVYRLAVILNSKIRFLTTKSRDTICHASYLKIVVKKIGLGDWFVLDMLAKNLDPQHFKTIINSLAKELRGDLFYSENVKPNVPSKSFF